MGASPQHLISTSTQDLLLLSGKTDHCYLSFVALELLFNILINTLICTFLASGFLFRKVPPTSSSNFQVLDLATYHGRRRLRLLCMHQLSYLCMSRCCGWATPRHTCI